MSDKLDRIVYLLDHWNDIFDGGASGSGSAGDPLGIALLPAMANHPSVKELDRCLKQLAAARPADYRHLKAYRVGVEWRNVTGWTNRKLASGKHEWVEERRRERITPRWLNRDRVSAAEVWLTQHFRGSVFIPRDLKDAWEAQRPAA